MKQLNISDYHASRLLCPVTKESLIVEGQQCRSEISDLTYPFVSGTPVIINERNSLFEIGDFVENKGTSWGENKGLLKTVLRALMPAISHNIKAKSNFKKIRGKLKENASILVIGGSVSGPGIKWLFKDSNYDVVITDVCFGEDVDVIFDCHDVPFMENTFDLVVAQSVLEHVVDPIRCVSEIHRVLRDDGLVYAETPFVQQVHMMEYDFTRYTHLGHRRLFRMFSEISSGSTGGPGMAFAWAYRGFLRSFSDSVVIRAGLTMFAHYTGFFWKYFDYLMIDKASASESASEYYFLGRKSSTILTDKNLLGQFRGLKW